MKKLLAVLLAFALVLSLCACAEEQPRTPGEADLPNNNQAAEPKQEPPIEVSEFGDPEDMPAPFADGVDTSDFTSDTYAITIGSRTFTPEWLYYQNIHDWVQAGIPFDAVEDLTKNCQELPMNSDAWEAFKTKISDFTMLSFMGTTDGTYSAGAPVITIGGDEYGFEWLSSHNATEYNEAKIPAATVKEYLDAIEPTLGYTPEYRWIKVVYDRMVNGW